MMGLLKAVQVAMVENSDILREKVAVNFVATKEDMRGI